MNSSNDSISTSAGRMIHSECDLYVCRICRTKTGHLHQKWCSLPEEVQAGCESCIYLNEKLGRCSHPYMKRCEKQ